MTGLIGSIWGAIKGLLGSKKVWTAVATTVAGTFIKDPALRDKILTTGAVLIGAQGAADWGKEAKK